MTAKITALDCFKRLLVITGEGLIKGIVTLLIVGLILTGGLWRITQGDVQANLLTEEAWGLERSTPVSKPPPKSVGLPDESQDSPHGTPLASGAGRNPPLQL